MIIPGEWPKQGTSLEPQSLAGEQDETELRDMTGHLSVSWALASTAFLLAMAHAVPGVNQRITRKGWGLCDAEDQDRFYCRLHFEALVPKRFTDILY